MSILNRKRRGAVLLTLLALVSTCATPCPWIAMKKQQAKRHLEAAAAIGKLGGYIDWSKPCRSELLRSLLGDDSFTSVDSVNFDGQTLITDDGLKSFKALPEVEELNLCRTKVTDAGLEHLKGLSQLRALGLNKTQVTDAGLEHLKGLKRLTLLYLEDIKITDTGLAHLTGLSELKVLGLKGTQVTNEGMKKLQQALPNCEIGQ